jgi:hypothetical protein
MVPAMKRLLLAASLLFLVLSATTAQARSPDTYQVTGQVASVEADLIVVMKGKEKFEIARDPADKTDVKVGDKVTVKYRMTAASIEKKK